MTTKKKSSRSKPKLIPVNLKQCQSMYKNGPFTIGGQIGVWLQCKNKPSVVIYEAKPGKVSTGGMSLCDKCLAIAKTQLKQAIRVEDINKILKKASVILTTKKIDELADNNWSTADMLLDEQLDVYAFARNLEAEVWKNAAKLVKGNPELKDKFLDNAETCMEVRERGE